MRTATPATATGLGDARLRSLLRANAVFSAITGAVAAVAADSVARALGVGAVGVVRVIGIGLVLYAVDLVVVSTLRRDRLVPMGRAAALGDGAWVAGTAAMLATGVLSTGGAVLLGLLALPVGALAITQWRAAGATA